MQNTFNILGTAYKYGASSVTVYNAKGRGSIVKITEKNSNSFTYSINKKILIKVDYSIDIWCVIDGYDSYLITFKSRSSAMKYFRYVKDYWPKLIVVENEDNYKVALSLIKPPVFSVEG